MERKVNYLGISSEIMSNSDHQLQEKLALLCHTIKDEKIDIMQIDPQNRDYLLPIYGYIGKAGDSIVSPSNFILPQLSLEQLLQPIILDHFLTQFFTLFDYQQQVSQSLSKGALIKFHSRYKYLIMAYSQVAYRELGRYIANLSDEISLDEIASKYQQKLMRALSVAPNREGQTNALMHMAGYFKRDLSSQQKQEMSQTILLYRQCVIPFSKPYNLLQYWLSVYPDDYLIHQRYFSPYPQAFDYLREQL
ncbi:YbgA family protein [Proteus faecis]|uniref:DUF1722 domain-containing protein n=2 Tax=Proteus faecis TaxID=2050967 RepID=A0AAW7CGD3_9GAMM|nr:DUF1722 domain-containing protein [Proteus faecis]MBG3011841.1 DUF1722 domain-containing protein [Proteus mirabilis]MDL5165509.1 DUF1722 domain-containing protein [Proteus faecis]MDL5274227.1 DUF1722 domain-containing protein [Proteus faecis]MDL5277797.1 DUF1722 domain-containing protein [Proteus faecis]MDL5306787.1 DUF1722 domain-containing protein [Proteus faecis]